MPNIWNVFFGFLVFEQSIAAIEESPYVVHGIWKNVAVYNKKKNLEAECISTRQYVSNSSHGLICGLVQVDLQNESPSITRFVWDALHSTFSQGNDLRSHLIVAVTVLDEGANVFNFLEDVPTYWQQRSGHTAEPAAICGDASEFRIFHLAEALSHYKAELHLQGPATYQPLFSSIASYLRAIGISCHYAITKTSAAAVLNAQLAQASGCNARSKTSTLVQPQPIELRIEHQGLHVMRGTKYSVERESNKDTVTWWGWAGRFALRSHDSASVRDTSAPVPPTHDAASGETPDVPVAAVTTAAACGVAMLFGVPTTVWLITRAKKRGYNNEAHPEEIGTNESLWSVDCSTIDEFPPVSGTPSSVDDTYMPSDEPGSRNEWAVLTLASVNYGQSQNQHPAHMLTGVSPSVTLRDSWFKKL